MFADSDPWTHYLRESGASPKSSRCNRDGFQQLAVVVLNISDWQYHIPYMVWDPTKESPGNERICDFDVFNEEVNLLCKAINVTDQSKIALVSLLVFLLNSFS